MVSLSPGSVSSQGPNRSAASSSSELTRASDEDLARALMANQPGAHYVAWLRLHPMVRRIVRRGSGAASDIEDLVQEVFLSLFRRIHTLREPVALRAFTMAIASRALRLELRRRRARWPLLAADTATDEVADELLPKTDPEAQHAVVVLEQLLRRLRSRDRDAFVLRYVEGMNAAEVAEALGVSAPTATRSITRAWKRIHSWARRDPTLVEYLRRQ